MSFVVSQVIVQGECEGPLFGQAGLGHRGNAQMCSAKMCKSKVYTKLQHPSCNQIGTSHGPTVPKVLPIASFIVLTVQLQVMKTWE